ncbi:MAG: c-type cytochrome, partial [Betaproteobacteria bacterium]|nr:c-type cytochrome [Betaproteobacteria bacterium]
MSDFISHFWHLYVAGITLASIIACLLLLWFSGKAKAMTANDNTTGHVWDGDLREMNNPLPRWWVGLFIITIIFGLVYLAMYPGAGSFAGKFGWSSAGQYEAEVAKGNAEVAPLYAKFSGMPPDEVSQDPQALAIGDRLFMNHCAQCHGSDARGSKGFPNLADSDWLYGGTPDAIKTTLI